MTQHRRDHSRAQPTPQVDRPLLGRRHVELLVRGHALVRELGEELVGRELADRVGDLLAEDRDQASVQAAQTFFRGELGEAGDETRGVLWVGDEPDAGRFEGREEEVGEESGEERGRRSPEGLA
jgi:hypothetical protein